MQKGGQLLNQHSGMLFSKLMGTGRGAGFSVIPNFKLYSMLTVFESAEHFHDFTRSPLWLNYQNKSIESFTVVLNPLETKGSWNKQNPFTNGAPATTELRAVITRASIRKRKLVQFWKQVPATSRAIEAAKQRIFSVGIGELPLIEQATFSLWESSEAIHNFAYKNAAHKKAVRDTPRINWYSEEMFARFFPIAAIGSFKGEKILKPFGITSFEDVPSLAELQSLSTA